MTKYVISYNKDMEFSTVESSLISVGCTILQVFESIGVVIVEAEDADFSSLMTPSASVPVVLAYEVDSLVTVHEEWHLNRITSPNLPMRESYITKNKGLGSTVYLIDSGVDTTHAELSSADIHPLWSWNNDFTDIDGHGTGLASIIVGATLGVSNEATVKSLKIPFGQSISISVLLNAFDVVLSDHLLTSGVKVVNCSWSIPRSMILDSKIAELQQQGLLVVAAAGNTMSDANTLSPVGVDTVLGVAASDAYDRVISWATGAGSNWGPDVDITAPGVDVQIAVLGGGTREASGTSIAAAVVSGCVCQYIVESPTSSATDVQDALLQNAKTDMLFRNETIYATTPNRLMFLPLVELMISPSLFNRTFEIPKGTEFTIPVVLANVVKVVNIHNIVIDSRTRTAPEWVTLENGVITVNPPVTLETGTYILEIEIIGHEDTRIGYAAFKMKIFNSSVDEINETDLGFVHVLDENYTVVVLKASCSYNFCSTSGECSGKGCGCGGGFCNQT